MNETGDFIDSIIRSTGNAYEVKEIQDPEQIYDVFHIDIPLNTDLMIIL